MTDYNVTIQDGNNNVVIQTEGPQGPSAIVDNTITFEGTGPAKIVYDEEYKSIDLYVDEDLLMYMSQDGATAVLTDMFNVEAPSGISLTAGEYLEMWSFGYMYVNGATIEVASHDGKVKINGIIHAVGEGSPEGVVEGPVGSKYTDKLATDGNIEWIKAAAEAHPTEWDRWDPNGWVVSFSVPEAY